MNTPREAPPKSRRIAALLMTAGMPMVGTDLAAQANFGAQTGNLSAQEYGDAVYRLLELSQFPFVYNYNHAGIYAGQSNGNRRCIETQGLQAPAPQTYSLQTSFTNYLPSNYYGAFTVGSGLTFSERRGIVATALSLINALPPIGYTLANALVPYTSVRPITPSNISLLRCDGLVEYCFEGDGNAIRSWHNATVSSSRWNIASWPSEHNNMPGTTIDPDFEMSPWAQRGAPGSSPNPGNARLNAPAVIALPTYPSPTFNRISSNRIDVTLRATDESGIAYIGYILPGTSSWAYSNWQQQHPTSSTFVMTPLSITTPGNLDFFAEDNGGNYPQYSQRIRFHSITASAGSGGSISPAGSWLVESGGSVLYSASPNTNYVVNQWLLDGNLVQTGGTSYLLPNIQANHSIQVTFTIPHYTINASAGAGGSIVPSGSFSVAAGSNQTFTATPNTNYVVDRWFVDSAVAQVGGVVYTLSNIQANRTVQVTFASAPSQYTITASAGPGGSIAPSGSFSVAAGSNQTFTATPNTNYVVDRWFVDSAVAQVGGVVYTLSNIQANRTVQVTFASAPSQYTITASAGPGGSIAPSGSFSVAAGGNQGFTATPNTNYVVDRWHVDSAVAQVGGVAYTLSNIQANRTVQVTFANAGAQSSVVAWGNNNRGQCNVPALPPGLTYVEISAGGGEGGQADGHTIARRSDGSVVAWGDNTYGQCTVPAPAPGLLYVQLGEGNGVRHSVALLSDGSVAAWGDNSYGQCNVPSLPSGLTYVEVSAGSQNTHARRSDGVILAWGQSTFNQLNVPALPSGLTYVDVAVGGQFAVARRSDGTLVAWGDNAYGQVSGCPTGNTYVEIAAGWYTALARKSDGTVLAWGMNGSGQANVPALPSGVSYVEIAAGKYHSVARRSDGSVVAWGDNTYGQCTVPALPSGQTYLEIAAGGDHTVARIGVQPVVAWGNNNRGQCNVPALPPGLTYVEISAGGGEGGQADGHTIARRSDGSVVAWGDNTYGQCTVPAPAPGLLYVQLGEGNGVRHSVALLSDGSVAAWGDNSYGQCNVPSLPSGLTYVEVSAGSQNTHARRSDGVILAWGQSTFNQLNVPALPSGLTYVDVAVGGQFAVARRSDGTLVAWGDNAYGQVSGCPTGNTYVEIAAGWYTALARKSDGTVLAWGMNGSGQANVPALPSGVSYVEIAAGKYHSVARRSDGSVVAWGDNTYGQCTVPALPSGQTYLEIASGGDHTVARICEATSVYVTFGFGCPGSQPTARLFPLDTPRIGTTLHVTLDHLPANIAFLCTGLSMTMSSFGSLPFSLASNGMPGCTLFVSVDAVNLLVGASGIAVYTLAIPNYFGLVGLPLYHQALVIDPAAANALGAVVSDAARAVVGQ